MICLLAIVVYISGLGNGFTFDDFYKLLDNPAVTSPDWSNPLGFFVPDEGEMPNPDRAIPQMLNAVEYALWGAQPFGYHLVNIVLHSLISVLFYLLVCCLFPNRKRIAILCAILFACHPIHTDVVSSIIGVGELLSSLCFVLILLLYVKSTREESRGWSWMYLATIPILFCGAFSKETAVFSLPFVAAAIDIYRFFISEKQEHNRYSGSQYIYDQGSDVSLSTAAALKHNFGDGSTVTLVRATATRLGRRFIKFYLPWLIVLMGIVIFSLANVSPPEVGANYLIFMPFNERLLEVFGIFMRYVYLLIWPFKLSCDYSFNQLSGGSVLIHNLWIGGGVVVAVLSSVLAWQSFRKKGEYFLALVIFAINYGIISNILLVINVSMAERLIYSASFGFCLGFGLLADSVLAKSKTKLRYISVWGFIIVIMGAYSVRTWTRNLDWRDNFTLFSSSCKTCPMSCRLNYNLGIEYTGKGQMKQAVYHYKKAVAAVPEHPLYRVNLGEAYIKTGEIDLAIAEFREATRLQPDNAYGFINLGGALEEKGDYKNSYVCLSIACELAPEKWQAFYNMGTLCIKNRRFDAAITAYKQVVKLDPEHWGGWHRLGIAYLENNQLARAMNAFEMALSIRPDYKEAYNNMGLTCIRLGLKDKARLSFMKALEIDPKFELARSNLKHLLKK